MHSTDLGESYRLEEELRASEQRFYTAFREAAQGMALADLDGKFIGVNEPFCQMLGYREDELLQLSIFDVTNPEDYASSQERHRSLIAGEVRSFRVEKLYRHKEGHHVPAILSVAIVRDGHGAPLHFVSHIQDVSERERALTALRKSEEDLRSITESIPQLAWMATEDGCNLWVNERWVKYTGLTLEASHGFGWLQALHEQDRARAKQAFEQANSARQMYEVEARILNADGTYHWYLVQGQALRDSSDSIVRWFGTCTDIHDRKVAAEERDRFFTLSLDMLCIAGPDGYFKRLNPAFESILGYTVDELCAKPFIEFVHLEDRTRTSEETQRVQGGATAIDFVNRFVCKDGSVRWLSWVAAVHEDLIYGVARDITPMRESEAELRKAKECLENRVLERTSALAISNDQLAVAKQEADQANRAKSLFLSRMSHELRTPMNAILGFAQLLEMDALNDGQDVAVKQILKAGRYLLNLINEVLDISKIESGGTAVTVEAFDPICVIEEAISMVSSQAITNEIRIEAKHLAGPDTRVMGDRQRFCQSFVNLLSNAIKYNRNRGFVRVTSSVNGSRWRAEVTDSGHGIAVEVRHRLFTPFDRLGAENSSVEGTGLGLALSKSLITEMGGRLGLADSNEIGATFFIELDVDRSIESETLQPAERVAPKARRSRVLYIEDNESNQLLMRSVFGLRPSLDLVTCPNGESGLEEVRSGFVDLVLLDLHLPDMPGEEVLGALRSDKATRDVPVVILSADAREAQIGRLLMVGANAYLTKPLDISDLWRTLDSLLATEEAQVA
jgi:PAS domain S-box-containing protein